MSVCAAACLFLADGFMDAPKFGLVWFSNAQMCYLEIAYIGSVKRKPARLRITGLQVVFCRHFQAIGMGQCPSGAQRYLQDMHYSTTWYGGCKI